MTDTQNSLVSTDWLTRNLDRDDLIVLDASRHLPAANRDPLADYTAAHIPGARFLDLASLTDTASPVPAALPNAQQLSERLAALGLEEGAQIVLYDDSGVKTSARAWFTLTAHGVRNVAILDGGLAKWRSEGRALDSGAPTQPARAAPMPLPDARDVVSKSDMLDIVRNGGPQILDARAADRVYGSGIDPVHGGQNGRIPGAFNLPFGKVFAADGTYLSPEQLRAAFAEAGIDPRRPIITTCGSGVTASVLLFALHLADADKIQLYDGSWQEWEADPDAPKEQGPAS